MKTTTAFKGKENGEMGVKDHGRIPGFCPKTRNGHRSDPHRGGHSTIASCRGEKAIPLSIPRE